MELSHALCTRSKVGRSLSVGWERGGHHMRRPRSAPAAHPVTARSSLLFSRLQLIEQVEGTQGQTSITITTDTPTSRGSVTTGGTMAGTGGGSILSEGLVKTTPDTATSAGALGVSPWPAMVGSSV